MLRAPQSLALAFALSLGALLSSCTPSEEVKGETPNAITVAPAQNAWKPEPEQAPVTSGKVEVAEGVELAYWDTGGKGEAVILLHAYTGSMESWGYQQPVLAAAGYRIIGYSRRGHFQSDPTPADAPYFAIDDLMALADQLEVEKFHLVGTAYGGFVASDFAVSHSERLLSLTIATSLGGASDAEFRARFSTIFPQEFMDLPHWLRELGPAYRAAYPEGVARWRELEEVANPQGARPQSRNALGWDELGSIEVPTLLIGGDADLFMPPPLLREFASHMQDPKVVVISEAGHSAYWEQYEAFNRVLIEFLDQNAAH